MRQLLNLLSPKKKTALRQGFIMAYAQSMLFFLFLMAFAITATLISVRLLLTGTYSQLAQPVAGTDDYSQNAGNIKMINVYSRRVESLIEHSYRWSEMLAQMSSAVPDGVILDDEVYQPDGVAIIRGLAATRDDLLAYEDRLDKLPFISDVTSPLSNLLQKREVRFELTMKYSPAAPAK